MITKSLICLTFGTITSLGLIFPLVTSAQTVNSQDPSEYQSNESDGLGGSFNPSDLIHQLTTGPERSTQEFQQDSYQNIENAADEYKRQQREKLNNQASPQPNQE